MFVYNAFRQDARVEREARTLTEAGWKVHVIAVLDRNGVATEQRDGFSIARIERNPPHYRLLRLAAVARRTLRRLLAVTRHAAGMAAVGMTPAATASGRGDRLHGGVRQALLRPHRELMLLDYYLRAFGEARRMRPDVCHAHDLTTLPVAVAVALATRGRVVYDAHELYPEMSTLSPRQRRWWRRIERVLISRATIVVTVCESIADELRTRHGIDRPTVLRNVPDLAAMEPPAPTGRLHRAAVVADDRSIVLYQGGLTPHRGLGALVDAAPLLDRDAVIVIMGSGPLESELRQRVERRGLGDRVRFVPAAPLAELLTFTADATVGVIPYEPVSLNNYYTTPNKMFEYMAASVPMVASDLPELNRHIRELGCGITGDCSTGRSLAQLVNGLLRDTEGLAAMRRAADEHSPGLSWEAESPTLRAAYDALAATPARPA